MAVKILKDKNFRPFLDEFASDEQEYNFRKWVFQDDYRLAYGALIITNFALALFLLMDLVFEGQRSILNPLFVSRIIVLSICSAMFFLLKNTEEFHKLDRIIFITLFCAISMVLISDASRPLDYFTHAGTDVAVLFLCYFISIGSVRYRIVISVIFSMSLLVLLFSVKQPAYNMTYMSYVSTIVVVNIFAYLIAVMLGRTKRQSYQMLLNERKMRQEIKSLEGIIPICSYCKNIRDDEGSWKQMEAYIHSHSNAQFSHGICPDCYPEDLPNRPSS